MPGDETTLRRLRIAALTDAPEAFGSTLERELARTEEDWQGWIVPGPVFLLETPGAEAVGLVAGLPDPTDADTAHLMSMWVHPDERGAGGADALIEVLLDWAWEEHGAARVRLYVAHDNVRARRVYERHGFRVVDRDGDEWTDRYHAMELPRSG